MVIWESYGTGFAKADDHVMTFSCVKRTMRSPLPDVIFLISAP
jgi:hypothetical protein